MKSRLRQSKRGALLVDDPLWYKDAIIYELRARSFADSNADGVGDFVGLTERLDYLQDLGVSALWLLPFYPSPGRDDGYDIANYTDVHPELGTLDDFKRFLDEAHNRGIRVITELVVNHTSDQHPWFQRARRAPPGSPERDFYVWSDTPDRYRDARIIFKDFEPSNWSWDPIARAYFWHRFFNHQPDLNYDSPQVQEAVFGVLDFWLGMGVDGLRLDAVPYLYEREGTSCENLPETHAMLKRLRAHIDSKFKNRMLLAEANQWPEDAAAYFGEGDECHMNFHFPIMPRIFMSIHMEDRFPLVDILAQTPQVPQSCQWALFLRNHDELTLEMVTDDERDYMYRAYAHEPSMRINLGIRRRLAPLMGNDRRKVELMNGLLFSLPGTPVVYYGDEIGMGDNVFLGDRNGVRTPMQWSDDRNAGFSRANPQRLVLPIIIDPEYHYESINVEAQENNPSSLLWWTKRLIALRKRHHAFGRGTIEFIKPDNPKVLVFIRQYEGELLLVVANLSRFVQFVEIDLSRFRGQVPVELFGQTPFPPIGELPYLLTLGGHQFYWFALKRPSTAMAEARAASYVAPSLESAGPFERIFSPEGRSSLEEVLPNFLLTRRWFEGRERPLRAVHVLEAFPLSGAGVEPAADHYRLLVLEAEYVEGEPERYALPVALAEGDRAADVRVRSPQSVIAYLHPPGAAAVGTTSAEGVTPMASNTAAIWDALGDPSSIGAVLDALAKRLQVRGAFGDLSTTLLKPLPEPLPEAPLMDARMMKTEHSSLAAFYDDLLALKFFRKLGEGTSVDWEVGRFLASRKGAAGVVANVPEALGALSFRIGRGEPHTLAVAQDYVPHESAAWEFSLGELRRFYERALMHDRESPPPSITRGSLLDRAELTPDAAGLQLLGSYPDAAQLMGQRVGELHRVLASDANDPAFAPEPFSALDQRSLYQSLRNLTGLSLRRLSGVLNQLPPSLAADVRQGLLEQEPQLYKRFESLLGQRLEMARIRVHGDLHLGQVLYTGKDFAIIDFEGDRSRPLSERRRKRSALVDVAGMICSFRRAAHTALRDESVVREPDRPRASRWAEYWHGWVSSSFLRGYLEVAKPASLLPKGRDQLKVVLDTLQIERSLVELTRELPRPGDRRNLSLAVLLSLLVEQP